MTAAVPAMAAALTSAVRRTEQLGGAVEAAVLAPGWSAPVSAGDAQRQVRMWSMSKPVAAVAALEATHGTKPSAQLMSAMTRAITRSENCPQRRVVLGLQALTGGPTQARAALRGVLAHAGATHAAITSSAPPPEAACQPYLQSSGLKDPMAGALTLGTSRWTVLDAVHFAAALGAGEYGRPGQTVLGLMQRTKHPSEELGDPSEYTPDPAWGAGKAFAGMHPAYKAGWGGVQQQSFLAGQLVVVHGVAIAAFFHPSTQPPIDDPGQTKAPQALELIFRAVRAQL